VKRSEYVVVSDPGDDPWDEVVCTSPQDAEIERILAGVAADGLDPEQWRPLLRVETRMT
jgi:hypothetical protein